MVTYMIVFNSSWQSLAQKEFQAPASKSMNNFAVIQNVSMLTSTFQNQQNNIRQKYQIKISYKNIIQKYQIKFPLTINQKSGISVIKPSEEMLKESEEIIPQQHECCYRYPIKLEETPGFIGLAYEGTIVVGVCEQEKGLVSHYDREGNLLSFLQIPKQAEIVWKILFEEQINLILCTKIKKHQYQYGEHYFMIKWNFKTNKKVTKRLGDKEIRKDKQILFTFYGNIYCILILQLQIFSPKIKYIRKMKINYFKSSEDLQKEPVSSLLVNVENDELFTNNSIDLIFFQDIFAQSNSLHPIFIKKWQIHGDNDLKLFVLNQNQQVSFHNLEIPTFQMKDIKSKEEILWKIEMYQQKKLQLKGYYNGQYFTFLWEINNCSMVFLQHQMNKCSKIKKKYYLNKKIHFNDKFLLNFKNSQQKSLEIKTTYCTLNDLAKLGQKNLYRNRFAVQPKSLSSISAKVFFNQNEIIISVKNENDQFKILLADLLEKMIDRCCEDLIQYVLQLLFQDTKIWRE